MESWLPTVLLGLVTSFHLRELDRIHLGKSLPPGYIWFASRDYYDGLSQPGYELTYPFCFFSVEIEAAVMPHSYLANIPAFGLPSA